MTAPIQPKGLAAPKPDERARLMKAAKSMEAVFMGQLLKAMRETVPDEGVIPKSEGEQMFTGMLDDEFAKSASRQSSHGLGEAMFRQLSRFLPAETPATSAPE